MKQNSGNLHFGKKQIRKPWIREEKFTKLLAVPLAIF